MQQILPTMNPFNAINMLSNADLLFDVEGK